MHEVTARKHAREAQIAHLGVRLDSGRNGLVLPDERAPLAEHDWKVVVVDLEPREEQLLLLTRDGALLVWSDEYVSFPEPRRLHD